MEEASKTDQFREKLKAYIETRIELLRLKVADKSSAALSAFVAYLLIVFLGVLFIIFASITAAYYISYCIGPLYSGFAIIGLLYLLLVILALAFRKKWISGPVRNKMIKGFFSKT